MKVGVWDHDGTMKTMTMTDQDQGAQDHHHRTTMMKKRKTDTKEKKRPRSCR
jgi:hypothetical protein